MLTPFDHIKKRRNGTDIYYDKKQNIYLKRGNFVNIQFEYNMYDQLADLGFHVPEVLDLGEDEGICYMTEKSLTGTVYSELFTNSFSKNGKIDDSVFGDFCDNITQYVTLQQSVGHLIEALYKDFDHIYQRLYEENQLKTKHIDTMIIRISNNLKDMPIVRNHGDYNPYNIYTDGIIDLEDCFVGPLGYDWISCLTHNFRFPTHGSTYTQQFTFSVDQINKFLKILSDTTSIGYTDNVLFGSLFMMRGCFVTAGSGTDKELMAYRYKKLHDAYVHYIAGGNMLDYFIKHYKTSIDQ